MHKNITTNRKASTSVGIRLKQERVRLGLSLDLLAEKTGICRATQANYERGRSVPRMDYLSKCRGIGIDINFVLEESNILDPRDSPLDSSTLAANLYGIIERNAGGAKRSLSLARRQELLRELLELLKR